MSEQHVCRMDARSRRRPGDRAGIGAVGRATCTAAVLLAACVLGAPAMSADATDEKDEKTLPKVTLVEKKKERRVDVLVDGQPFTSYIWPDTLKKPTLHPIHTASGIVVTRGFPPGKGERADHPHHVGLWFNYGDVNGYDFWNNSTAVTGARAEKMGTVRHRDITRKKNGNGKAELGVTTQWVVGPKDMVLLEEDTLFTFHAPEPGVRMIDRHTLLRPVGRDVFLKDNKEGLLGLRVRRELEDPNEKSGEFMDASGVVTKMENMDATGVTGVYTSSEGKKGAEVWGTRGRWTMLSGTVEGKPVTIAILDHPGNPGFPTFWHARGYGLFAANPLGQAAFTEGKQQLNFVIPAYQSQLFRYRVLLLDRTPTPEEMERYYAAWAGSAAQSSARR
ncbi:MAG TPA: PmoA family protein [Vicinamibacterales bacterium]